MASIEDVLSKLDAVSGGGQRRQWSARCPCRNDDEHPSLRVSIGTDEQILLHCRRGGGCDAETIARELGYTMQDLWPGENEVQINRRKPKMTGTKEKKTKTNTYKYYDENGILVMEVLRFVTESGKKTFQQRKPSSDGGWEWQMGDMEKPLYRLPQVLRAKERGDTIYVVEGEKDVETLESLGKTATTQPGGAGGPGQRKWMPWHTEALAGANIVQLIDNDDPGRLHARHVHDELIAAGCKVKTYAPPKQYKDVSDMVEDGGKLAELESFDVANVSLDLNVAEPEDDPNEPLFKFAAEIDDVINGSASVERRAELIRAKADNLILTVQGEQLDRGKHVNWKDFLEEEADLSYDWVIPNVLERGERVMLVASEGAGKTTLIRQVAMLVSAGIHPFKHNVEIPPMRTLMIDMENPERITRRTTKRIADRIKALPKHWERMDGAHLVMKPDGVNLFKAADRALIEEYVETVRPDILFFGPVYKSFIDPGGRTPEAICTDLVRFFDYIRTTYDCALWLEHHAPLGSGGQRQLRPFGSAVWSRWSEFGLAIEADPADPELIQFNHYRGQREPREWPKLCRRGVVWPYEVVEFADFNPLDGSVPDRKAQAETLADTSIDTGDNPW